MENYENSNRENRLKELGGSDFQIVEGQPNIKGWTVKDNLGRILGEVDELLFDPESRKVHYLVLDLDDNELDLDDREVLIPIGLAQLHEEDDDVILPNITVDQLSSLPKYDYDGLNPEIERTVYGVFAGVGAGALGANSSLYDHDYYNENNLYQRRQGSANARIEGKTVIGIFDSGFEAQNAITQLKSSGFDSDRIDVATREDDDDNEQENGISNFFGNLFSDHDEASRYTELAKRGSVVTVQARSSEEALQAAEILDQHGAKDFDEGYTQFSKSDERENVIQDQDFTGIPDEYSRYKEGTNKKEGSLRSRIIEGHVEYGNRLRSEKYKRDTDAGNRAE
ncbi:MAG: hypothetical protein JWQ25_369 [Daejeonella sp.]|nr:hypothetical protein [Daejeonella sp.]